MIPCLVQCVDLPRRACCMDGENVTMVMHFVLLSLSESRELPLALFALFSVTYLLILVGVVLIMVMVSKDWRLHTPMYCFLANLSFIDLCHASVSAPKMLADLLSVEKTISFGGCVAQLFFLHLCTCAEIFLLTVMAYDCYCRSPAAVPHAHEHVSLHLAWWGAVVWSHCPLPGADSAHRPAALLWLQHHQ
ncbi:unnamed protein product [Lepidochelys olivacea]